MAVYAKQYGRLGNNLFQRAAAIGYGVKHDILFSQSAQLPIGAKVNLKTINLREGAHRHQDLPFKEEWRDRVILLDGYWQSEKYFSHCREEVLKALGYKWIPVFPETCAIHVRRGDYLMYPDKHPAVTNDYIVEAIQEIAKRTDVKRFLFFSDDIGWCKVFAQFYLPQKLHDACEWAFSQGLSDQEDLELMSSCQHQIISNSTFSWWAAWLGQNSDKVVVSPHEDNWFGPGNKHLDVSDLIPERWIKIKY